MQTPYEHGFPANALHWGSIPNPNPDTPMLLFKSAVLALALAAPAALNINDEGQGTAQPGTHVSDLRMGTYLLGAAFDTEEMLGKVLVVEIGGG